MPIDYGVFGDNPFKTSRKKSTRLKFDSHGRPIKEKPKRKTLTSAQRIYIWERPKIYGRKCSICLQTITKLSDLELDHTKAHSKGGKKLALAHKDCNRLKSNKSLNQIQKLLGIKTAKKKTVKKKITKKKTTSKKKVTKRDPFEIPRISLWN